MSLRNRHRAQFRAVARALPRLGDVFIQLIDLLQGQTLGFIDHGEREHERDPAEATPDPEHVGLGWVEGASQIRRDVR